MKETFNILKQTAKFVFAFFFFAIISLIFMSFLHLGLGGERGDYGAANAAIMLAILMTEAYVFSGLLSNQKSRIMAFLKILSPAIVLWIGWSLAVLAFMYAAGENALLMVLDPNFLLITLSAKMLIVIAPYMAYRRLKGQSG